MISEYGPCLGIRSAFGLILFVCSPVISLAQDLEQLHALVMYDF